ncbi:MAG: DNA-formamidopyrimidine glycosylase [Erysipelotrichaceae bacterium]|nr:DNA-formamidopyrimidine glycosylase [Erysipelotrichaceae bacterium]
MPELPEVETVVRSLEQRICDCTILSVDVRYPKILENCTVSEFSRLCSQKFESFGRRGKYLIFTLTKDVLICHLRMEGKFFVKDNDTGDKHTHVVFQLDNGRYVWYHDTRKFGRMWIYSKEEEWNCLRKLGKEPFDDTLYADDLYRKYHTSQYSLKELLLDQSVVCGIGNIYANEICFLMKRKPTTRVSKLTRPDFRRMIKYTKEVLQRAIELGGTTVHSFQSDGVDGLFQIELLVYGKENCPCSICTTPIKKIMWKGRGTYWCPKCQR